MYSQTWENKNFGICMAPEHDLQKLKHKKKCEADEEK